MKQSKKDKINLFFSAFLILGYLVCSYFFMTLASQLSGVGQAIVSVLVFLVFGLLLFYATRVGDGKPVKRFSWIVLVVVDIPCLFAILASVITFMPLHSILLLGQPYVWASPLFILACVALGYGIPYTFLSGFEMVSEEEIIDEDEEAAIEETEEIVKGGIAEELLEVEEIVVSEKTDEKEDDIEEETKEEEKDEKESNDSEKE